jgi:hypothetical protein
MISLFHWFPVEENVCITLFLLTRYTKYIRSVIMGFDVSNTAANAVLYTVLIFFTFLAIVSGGYLNSCLPEKILSCCLLRSRVHGNNSNNNAKSDADHFLSARNSASAREIALSFFASGMGAWVRFPYCVVSSILLFV